MEQLLLKLSDLGVIGIILAIMVYDVFYLQKQILKIIENNTKAMSDLKNYCSTRGRDSLST
jgi:hypothetical protein